MSARTRARIGVHNLGRRKWVVVTATPDDAGGHDVHCVLGDVHITKADASVEARAWRAKWPVAWELVIWINQGSWDGMRSAVRRARPACLPAVKLRPPPSAGGDA